MKKSVSLLGHLLLSSTLFWAIPSVGAEEMLFSIPTDSTAYCRPEYRTMREDRFSWQPPVPDSLTANIVDFNDPCDYDPSEEIGAHRRLLLPGDFGDAVREGSRSLP